MKIIRDDSIFPFIAYVPEKLSERPSLIIQLHGAGERGSGGEDLDRVLVHGFSKIATDETLKDSILVMPQCPLNSFWVAKIESINAFIDKMIERFNADENRIYLCGLSMGGFGTWYTSMAYPDKFAAIVPCCGGGMAWFADALKMPIWAFHGLCDTVVSPSQTIEMADKLKMSNPDFKCTLFEGVGHNSWDKAFVLETLNWLLSHKKAK